MEPKDQEMRLLPSQDGLLIYDDKMSALCVRKNGT